MAKSTGSVCHFGCNSLFYFETHQLCPGHLINCEMSDDTLNADMNRGIENLQVKLV